MACFLVLLAIPALGIFWVLMQASLALLILPVKRLLTILQGKRPTRSYLDSISDTIANGDPNAFYFRFGSFLFAAIYVSSFLDLAGKNYPFLLRENAWHWVAVWFLTVLPVSVMPPKWFPAAMISTFTVIMGIVSFDSPDKPLRLVSWIILITAAVVTTIVGAIYSGDAPARANLDRVERSPLKLAPFRKKKRSEESSLEGVDRPMSLARIRRLKRQDKRGRH